MWPTISRSSYFNVCICVASVIAAPLEQRGDLSPVLTTIRNTPELSIFYSLFSSTGGESGIPGPALEERFNDPSNALAFTVFAPTNQAFANVSAAALAALTAPSSYSLLYSLLINHIAPGALTPADLQNNVHEIGGFDLDFTAEGTVLTNPGVSNVEEPVRNAPQLVRGPDGQAVQVPASNGVVYQIDHVINGLYTYFGSDVPLEGAGGGGFPQSTTQPGTMLDILNTAPELSILRDLWRDLDPDFLTRLALEDGKDEDSKTTTTTTTTVYLAPGNAAFEGLPKEAIQKARQPSNADLSSFLLGFGFGELEGGVGDGKEMVVKSARTGFEIGVNGGVASNARIERTVCAENGCVWILRRWLDPLFGIF